MLLYGLFLVLSVSRAAEDGKSTRGLATAVKRFSERLKNTFNEQTRFTLIEKGFVENIYGKTEASFLDFIKITDETHKKVKVLFEKKIHAVRKIAKISEEVNERFNYDKLWNENDTNCESYLRRIGTYNVYNMTKNLNPKKSAVHINIESYKCGNSVLRDFEWTGHGKIEEVMKQNLDEDPTILRQYIGTYSGLTRLLPAIKWEIEPPDVTFDLFDPRFRPWFVGAESAPKDILFLLDYSGSVKGQTLYLIKVTILYILTTLTPNDYFNAIWYNSQQDFVLGSHHNCTDGFLPATTRNKRMLRDYLNKIEEHDQASLPPALNMSFAQFIKSNSNDPDKINARSGGHQIIMLFTDGGLEEWPTNIVLQHLEQYPENNVRVFGYSMGFSTGRAPLEWTSCETKGDSTIIDTITDVKTQSRFHLKKLSEILALTYKDKKLEERPIIWSPSYMDTQKAGAVLSASLPILNTMENATAGFLGIAAVDLSFSQIRKIIPVHDQFYGFIIDNNGIVLFHPHLKLPKREVYSIRRTACYNLRVQHRTGTRIQYGDTDERVMKLMGLLDSIPTMDILEIEPETKIFSNFRKSMLDGECGKIIDDGDRQYRCFKIEDTPLVLGFVYKKTIPFISLKQESRKPKYSDKELVGYHVQDGTICPDELSNLSPLERWDALVFGEYANCAGDSEKRFAYTLLNSLDAWSNQWPELQENATCSTNPLPGDLNSLHFTSSFVKVLPGISTFYPKCNYDSLKSYLNFMEIENRILNKPTKNLKFEHDQASNTIVATKKIFDDSKFGQELATVGIQWSADFLNEFLRNSSVSEPGWKECFEENHRCFLVTASAYVLARIERTSPLKELKEFHLAGLEPLLFAQLLKTSVLKLTNYRDYQAECRMQRKVFQSPSASPNGPRPFSIGEILRNSISFLYSLFWIELFNYIRHVASQPIYIGGECHFEASSNLEQCTLQYYHYRLYTSKPLFVHLTENNACSGTVMIVPMNGTELYLFMINSTCSIGSKNVVQHEFLPTRVPDCNQTRLRYRKKRPDLDYTTFHTEEQVRECTSGANSLPQLSHIIFMCILMFILIEF